MKVLRSRGFSAKLPIKSNSENSSKFLNHMIWLVADWATDYALTGSDMAKPDSAIPLRLKDLILAIRSRLEGSRSRVHGAAVGVTLVTSNWQWQPWACSPAMIERVLGCTGHTYGHVVVGRTRWCWFGCRWGPETAAIGCRSCGGGRFSRVIDEFDVPMVVGLNEVDDKVRLDE